MARVLKAFEFSDNLPKYNAPRPWGTWLDGRIWELDPNDDFPLSGDPIYIPRTIRMAAARRGLAVRISRKGACFVIQAYRIGEVDPEIGLVRS